MRGKGGKINSSQYAFAGTSSRQRCDSRLTSVSLVLLVELLVDRHELSLSSLLDIVPWRGVVLLKGRGGIGMH